MRNQYGNTPQEQARSEILTFLHQMALTDETESIYFDYETPSFIRAKRKHFGKLMNKLANEWGHDVGGKILDV